MVIKSIRIPPRRHSRATGARGTTRLYYTPKGGPENGFPLMMVSVVGCCHSEDANGPREMLSMVHTPIMETASPQALGLSPTLISPIMEEY